MCHKANVLFFLICVLSWFFFRSPALVKSYHEVYFLYSYLVVCFYFPPFFWLETCYKKVTVYCFNSVVLSCACGYAYAYVCAPFIGHTGKTVSKSG